MNISRHEQRVLHVLSQGGAIRYERKDNGKIRDIACITRDGHMLPDCTMHVFERLKKRRFIHSSNGKPYRVTRLGLVSVRSQPDNR
jgi:uncharacterized protein YjhX (UPF0386 family)